MTTEFDEAKIEALIAARIAAREGRDFAEADRLRGELDALGLVIIDEKDPATGKLTTTWRPR